MSGSLKQNNTEKRMSPVISMTYGTSFLLCKKIYKEGYVFWADYYMMINIIFHRREHVQKESGGLPWRKKR